MLNAVTVVALITATCIAHALPLSASSSTSVGLSVARAQLSAGSVDNYQLFAGGYDAAGNDSTIVDIFNTQTMTWSLASLSTGRGVMGAASLSISSSQHTRLSASRSVVVFAGGKHSKGLRTDVIDVFDAVSEGWSVEHLSDARSMVAVVGSPITGNLYFAGGEYAENEKNQTTKECSDIVDVWNIAADTWSKMKLSQPRKKLGAAVAGSKVLFGGGYLSGVGNVDTVDIFDEYTGNWTVAKLSTPRFRLQTASLGPLALFISGQGCDWTCASADVYDSRTGQWTITRMAQGRYEFAAVVVDGLAVVAGGKQPRPKGLNPNLVEIFDPSTMAWRNSSMVLATPRFFLAGTGTDFFAPGMALFGGGLSLVKGQGPLLQSVEMMNISQLLS